MKDGEIVYGRKAVFEIVKNSPDLVQCVFLKKSGEFDPQLEELLIHYGISYSEALDEQLTQLSGGGQHQGVVAQITQGKSWSLGELAKNALSKKEHAVLVVFDEIVDPQNVGSLLRVSEASGVAGVIITKHRSCAVTPVVRKVSMGASELIPLCYITNLQQALTQLKKLGFWIVGTSLEEAATNLYETEIPFPMVLVLGSEGKGLRKLTAKECDFLVTIPMQGKLQSLNVSQAGAIVLFELQRRQLIKKN